MKKTAVRFILIINIAVFLLWALASSSTEQYFMIQNFLVSWTWISEGRVWTALTSVFSHNMFFHLFLNMYVLTSFGPVLETGLGTARFLKFYLLAGIFSSLCHCLVSTFILGEPDLPALGASGAISGMILLFSLFFPKRKIFLFGFIPLPAIWGALVFIGLDIWGLVAQAEGGGLPIGHGAHLGGALAGTIYYFVLKNRVRSDQQI